MTALPTSITARLLDLLLFMLELALLLPSLSQDTRAALKGALVQLARELGQVSPVPTRSDRRRGNEQ